MKKLIKFLNAVLIIEIAISILFLTKNISYAESDEGHSFESYSSGFYITSYDVHVDVNEYNQYHIKETINCYFTESKHGIIRQIPKVNTVRRTDGTTTQNRANISNVEVSEDYEKTNENQEVKLKIGSSDRTVTGAHTYVISYDYNIRNDKSKGFDEFYFNLIGNKWTTDINKVTFTVNMPKEFDTTKIGFSAGSYGTSGIADDGNFGYAVLRKHNHRLLYKNAIS